MLWLAQLVGSNPREYVVPGTKHPVIYIRHQVSSINVLYTCVVSDPIPITCVGLRSAHLGLQESSNTKRKPRHAKDIGFKTSQVEKHTCMVRIVCGIPYLVPIAVVHSYRPL